MRPKIAFHNVSKSFNLYKKQSDKLLEIISFNKNKDQFFALKNLSFEIFEGEVIGVLGLNGSGKSTLSNLLGQVIPPSSGSIEINGETSLIAISAGLNNQLTGLENIELKCLMHGLNKEEIETLKPKIIEFADIGKFINQPVKNYSSGMKSRLGFAISIHTNPDILIVDEALSVGDQTFYEKCLLKMNEFKSQGKTIIFISHSLAQIESFCDRVMWIHFGRIEKFNKTKEVLVDYKEFIKWFNNLDESEKKKYREEYLENQYGDKESLDTISTRKTKKKRSSKKGSAFYSIQVILLFVGVVLSASLMFGIKPVQSIENYISSYIDKEKDLEEISLDEEQPKRVSKQIEKKGIVFTKQAIIYSDIELNTELDNLTFSDEVYVEEQLNDNIYKIRVNSTTGYLSKESVKLLEADMPTVQLGIEGFLPFFPERFANAFEYFFTFLNTEKENVKSKVGGLTNEEILDNGESFLTYGVYDAQYRTNSDGITKSLTVNNIDTNNVEWNRLKELASLTSLGEQHYLFKTDLYNIVIDTNNETATFSLVK
jgi:teichoic acid transport system ATP-binding protein